MSKYTITEGEAYGQKAFIALDKDGNYAGSFSTQEEAEKVIKAWEHPIAEIAQPAFEFKSDIYGSYSKPAQEKGNSEDDEDRSFGL